MNDHEESGLIGAYILGALEPGEVEDFEAHLADCATCRLEVDELSGIPEALALAAPPVEPPDRLRAGILAATAPRRRPAATRPLIAVVGLAAVLALAALGWHDVQLQNNLNQRQQALARQQQVLAALTRHARVSHVLGTAAAPHASAAIIQPPHGIAYLVVRNLPPLASAHVYQAWLIHGTQPVSAGVFSAGNRTAVVPLTRSANGFAAAAVTIEPGPHGSSQPTGQKVLLGQL